MTTITNSPYMDLLVEDTVEPAPKCAGEGVNPELFDPKTQLDFDEAVSICRGCPMRAKCQTEGMANEEHGVWGGVLLQGGRVQQPRFRTIHNRSGKKPKYRAGRTMTPDEFSAFMREATA